MATAARAWWRSRASACWRPRAAATRPKAWRSRPTARGASPARRCRSSCCSRTSRKRPTRATPKSISGQRSWRSASRDSSRGTQPAADLSHPAMAVNLDACIQCGRCVRACREEQVNDVIGYAYRGGHSKIVFDLDDPMGNSTCVACGECVQACPTGALMPARDVGQTAVDKQVSSVCPYCGVGCQLTYNIKGNTILYVEGRDGPANSSRLCVKGRYGFDYVQHRHRLTKPLIRKPGVPKHKDFTVDPEKWHEVFREATWEEALEVAAKGLRDIRDTLRQARARGLRLGERHERRGVSLSEARAHGLRVEQRRPLHAPVPCLERGGAHGGHQLRRRLQSGARRRERRGDVPHRRQSRGEPSGGGHVDEERRQERDQAHPGRSAPKRAGAPRHLLPAVQSGHRRGAAERHAPRHRDRRPGRRNVHPRSDVRLRRARREREEVLAGGDGAHLRHRCADHPRGRAAVRHVARVDHPVGHGHFAARARHRQRAVPDRAGALHRPDRQAGLGLASAARPEQRAGRIGLGTDPDVLSGLPAREHAGGASTIRETLATRSSTRIPASRSSRS